MIVIENNKVHNISLEEANESFQGKLLPAVIISVANNTYSCNIGYHDFTTNSFFEKSIVLENVRINKVSISTTPFKKNRWQTKLFKFFYYDIEVEALDIQGKETQSQVARHIFRGVDKIEKSGNGGMSKEFCRTFSVLFEKVIPGINKVLNSGISPQDINYDYFDLFFVELKKVVEDNEYVEFHFYWDEPIIKLEDILHLVYTLEVEEEKPRNHIYEEDDHIYKITSHAIKDYPANSYIESLIGIPIHVNCEMSLNSILYSWNIPAYFKYDAITVKRELIKHLYYKIFTCYNNEKAQLGFKYKVENRNRKIDICNFSPEEEFLLNFVYDMRVGVFEDGQSRVGRDDYAWTETTYIFGYEHGFKPNNETIETINSLLSISLEDDEKGLRWYYRCRSDSESIPGACHRYGAMNESSREPYFNILMKYFLIDIYDKRKSEEKGEDNKLS